MLTIAAPAEGAWLHTPGAHKLLVADTDGHRRSGVAAWVGGELARGAKVYYKGWLPEDARPDQHWIVGPTGAPGAGDALVSGQFEFLDYPAVIQRCGGTTEGLLRMQTDEVERAMDEGWASVAMSQETNHRPMADDAEAAEFARQERGYDLLSSRWPVRTLCQLTVDEENAAAAWEATSIHYREVTDGQWTSAYYGGRWQLGGALDAHVANRFGAALYGALQGARRSPDGPDLNADMASVNFLDFACAQVLILNAHSVSRQQRVVLHRTPDMFRHLIVAAGRPRTLLFDDETGGR